MGGPTGNQTSKVLRARGPCRTHDLTVFIPVFTLAERLAERLATIATASVVERDLNGVFLREKKEAKNLPSLHGHICGAHMLT